MNTWLYQACPSARARDAVGRMALGISDFLQKRGLSNLIFTEKQHSFLGGRLRKGLLNSTPWGGNPVPQIALLHHSIGSVSTERFLEWPAKRKVVIYHNITPVELAENDCDRKVRAWGFAQLKALVERCDLVIGLSQFSCDELTALGAKSVRKLPYYLWKVPKSSHATRSKDILIVGRIEPHKRVLEAVRAFAHYHRQFPQATLHIVGNVRANPQYVQAIAAAGRDLPVRLYGKISEQKLAKLYSQVGVLLTLSQHEGFCVPIAQAVASHCPVVAYRAGAIPETLGEAGILVDFVEPSLVSEALVKAMGMSFFQQAELQFRRYSPETFESSFLDELKRLDYTNVSGT